MQHRARNRAVGPDTMIAIFLAVALATVLGSVSAYADDRFDAWLNDLKREAIAKGVSEATFDRAFEGVAPVRRIVELDRRQPEFTQTFWQYMDRRVTEERVRRGRELLARHRGMLNSVADKFGVQPRFLVAIWGMESNFGDYTGTFPLVGAVATQAYDERRAAFFREQLLAALTLIERGDVSVDAKSSWAGAMGQTQFIPTTYRDFAIDFDGDNKRDLWGSLPDIFASSSRYLSAAGWQGDRTWGREVRLPSGFDFGLTGLKARKPLAEWQRLGVRRVDGRDLPVVDIEGSIVLPGGAQGGPAFMVYQNFRTILVWNRSILYAVAVGHLADRLAGAGAFLTPRPANDVALSRDEVMEIQSHLARLGLQPGTADGIVGPATRGAIRSFQRAARLPPDGFPTIGLLERLRAAGN